MTNKLKRPLVLIFSAAVLLALLMFAPSEITRSTGFEIIAGAEEAEEYKCPQHSDSYLSYSQNGNGTHYAICYGTFDESECGFQLPNQPCTFNDYGQCVHCGWDCNHPSKEADGKCSLCGCYEVSERETAVSLIKKALLNRDAKVRMILTGAIVENHQVSEIENIIDGLYSEAITHTSGGNSALGDYIAKTIETYGRGRTYDSGSSGLTVLKTCYSFTYYTTSEQEQYVTNTLNTIYSDLNLSDSSLTDLEKVYKIYNWIVTNVSYDYDNLNNESNKTKYTAYGALNDKKAVCQGFASLFYRMCLDNGIDCRIVTGTSKGENHAWNIVKVGEKYYYADPTWDCFVIEDIVNSRQAKPGTFFYFLRGTLPNHTESAEENVTSAYTGSMAGAEEYLSAFKAAIVDGAATAVHLDETALSIWYKITSSGEGCAATVTVTPNVADAELAAQVLLNEVPGHSFGEDGLCTICGESSDSFGAKLGGHSLSLAGNIAVKFYMELDEAVAADNDAYMQFTLPNGKTTTVLVTAATQETISEKTYHVFTCEVAAKEMTAEIRAQMFDGSGNSSREYTYTVRDYADYILAHTESYSAETVALVKAMLNYGGYSQVHFGYNTEKLANAGIDTSLPDVTAETLSAYAPQITANNAVCTFASAYLTLESETSANVKVKLADGVTAENVTVTVNGKSVNLSDCEVSGGYYILTVKNISSNQLDKIYTYTLTVGDNTASINFGALSYCHMALSSASTEADVQNMCKSLYAYNLAADAYCAA